MRKQIWKMSYLGDLSVSNPDCLSEWAQADWVPTSLQISFSLYHLILMMNPGK